MSIINRVSTALTKELKVVPRRTQHHRAQELVQLRTSMPSWCGDPHELKANSQMCSRAQLAARPSSPPLWAGLGLLTAAARVKGILLHTMLLVLYSEREATPLC